MSKRFKLYNVDIKYIRNLHKVDDNVPSVSPQIGKLARPFLGIIVLINGSKFPVLEKECYKKKNYKLGAGEFLRHIFLHFKNFNS